MQNYVQCQNILGECPIWDDQRQLIIWIDIEGKLLLLKPTEGPLISVPLPEKCGSFALTESNTRLLLALESTLAWYYFDT